MKLRIGGPAILFLCVLAATGIVVGGWWYGRAQTVSGAGPGPDTTAAADSGTHLLRGTVTLQSVDGVDHYGGPLGNCAGTNGFSDLAQGSGVTVSDEKGTIVATGSMSDGTSNSVGWCVLTFAVPGVPKRPFYKVEVSHRGGVTYSYQQMSDAGWSIATTIG